MAAQSQYPRAKHFCSRFSVKKVCGRPTIHIEFHTCKNVNRVEGLGRIIVKRNYTFLILDF